VKILYNAQKFRAKILDDGIRAIDANFG